MILLVLDPIVVASGCWLRSINLSHLRQHGMEVPSGFEGAIDAETLAGTAAYTPEPSALCYKFSPENLAGLHPRQPCAMFPSSRPPVVERVNGLRQNMNSGTP